MRGAGGSARTSCRVNESYQDTEAELGLSHSVPGLAGCERDAHWERYRRGKERRGRGEVEMATGRGI